MKYWATLLCLMMACACVHASGPVRGQAPPWQPAAGLKQMPIWPATPPDAQPMPGPEMMVVRSEQVAGRPWRAVTNVDTPTMTVYPPKGSNTGAAVVVFPGGGFEVLAIDLEGSEICDWLTARGITCVLLKYRVPSATYDWHCRCRPHNFALSVPSLQDAQRTLRLVRFRARDWHVDPHRVGVIGFSAGGYLVAEASTNYRKTLYPATDAADRESARPDFALAIYPGHLTRGDGKLNPNVPVTADTPPTFILQASDDDVDGVQQALTYYAALQAAKVPTELHIYAKGGHAFGLRRTGEPITAWTDLADVWLRTIGIRAR